MPCQLLGLWTDLLVRVGVNLKERERELGLVLKEHYSIKGGRLAMFQFRHRLSVRISIWRLAFSI